MVLSVPPSFPEILTIILIGKSTDVADKPIATTLQSPSYNNYQFFTLRHLLKEE
jgi:hypothetical protein